MVLHAQLKNTFSKLGFCFYVDSETSPPSGLVRDQTFFRLFLQTSLTWLLWSYIDYIVVIKLGFDP